jgi:hypothetical protein
VTEGTSCRPLSALLSQILVAYTVELENEFERGRRDAQSRDLVAQTGQFVRDPANAHPHYPLRDMNRGFGP